MKVGFAFLPCKLRLEKDVGRADQARLLHVPIWLFFAANLRGHLCLGYGAMENQQ